MIFVFLCLKVQFLMISNSVALNLLVRDLCENLIKAMGSLLKKMQKIHTQKTKSLTQFYIQYQEHFKVQLRTLWNCAS